MKFGQKCCWLIDSSSGRIVEDIEGFPRVLDNFFDFSGCVVPDMNFRSGRRVKSHHNKRDLTKKIRSRQRILMQKRINVHSDVQGAFDNLLKK